MGSTPEKIKSTHIWLAPPWKGHEATDICKLLFYLQKKGFKNEYCISGINNRSWVVTATP